MNSMQQSDLPAHAQAALLPDAPVALLRLSAEACLVACNRAGLDVLGITAAALQGAPATLLWGLNAADLVGVNLFRGRLEPTDHGAGILRAGEGAVTVAWPDDVPREPVDDVPRANCCA